MNRLIHTSRLLLRSSKPISKVPARAINHRSITIPDPAFYSGVLILSTALVLYSQKYFAELRAMRNNEVSDEEYSTEVESFLKKQDRLIEFAELKRMSEASEEEE